MGFGGILGTQTLRRAELVIASLFGRSDYFWVTEGVLSGSPALAWSYIILRDGSIGNRAQGPF